MAARTKFRVYLSEGNLHLMRCNNSPLVLENPASSGLRNPFNISYPHRQEMGLQSNIP